MTRILMLLVAVMALLAGTAASRAQGVDMREMMGGGPSFYRYGNGGNYQGGGYYRGGGYQDGGTYGGTFYAVNAKSGREVWSATC